MSDQGLTRRSVLMAAGAGGVGLATAGAIGAVASYRAGMLSHADRRRLPRVPEGIRPTDRAALGRAGIAENGTTPALASRLVELRLSPGEELAHLGIDVRQSAAEFVCDPRRPNLLLEGASKVTYEIHEVAWQPGDGGPIYRTRAPHDDRIIGLRYAGVPRHQIVLLDDRAVFVGNPGTCGVIEGIQGALRIDVNGEADGYASHRGFYKLLITGIA